MAAERYILVLRLAFAFCSCSRGTVLSSTSYQYAVVGQCVMYDRALSGPDTSRPSNLLSKLPVCNIICSLETQATAAQHSLCFTQRAQLDEAPSAR